MTSFGTVETNSASIAYDEAGEGTAVVLVHAGICDRTMWDDVWDSLAARYRVVRYDCRGFGQTTVSADVPYANGADLVGVMDHLGIDKAVFVGVSRAGAIVLTAALAYPDRVLAVVPVAAGLPGYDPEPTAAELDAFDELERLEEAEDWSAAIEAELRIWVDGLGQPHNRIPAVRERVRAMMEALHRDHAEDPLDKVIIRKPPAGERLKEYAVPVLVIVGDLDISNTITTARHLAAEVPGALLEVMTGVAHLPPMERPAEFVALLTAFVDSL